MKLKVGDRVSKGSLIMLIELAEQHAQQASTIQANIAFANTSNAVADKREAAVASQHGVKFNSPEI